MRNPIHVITKVIAHIKHKRSNHWPTVRKHWLEIHPSCAACGGLDHTQVHHIQPFHLNPELELEPTNFITLCEKMGSECHLKFGHTVNGHSSWKINNPNVVEDVKNYGIRSK